PICEKSGTTLPAGKAKSFIVPWSVNVNAAAIRRTLQSCGENLSQISAIFVTNVAYKKLLVMLMI
ncbi:MAG: hypothetical protein B7Z63_02910, partial [Ignavibacteriae bacterium 37-53-5]